MNKCIPALLLLSLMTILLTSAQAKGSRHLTQAAFQSTGWRKENRADRQEPIRILIGLEAAEPQVLEETFWNISDPA